MILKTGSPKDSQVLLKAGVRKERDTILPWEESGFLLAVKETQSYRGRGAEQDSRVSGILPGFGPEESGFLLAVEETDG